MPSNKQRREAARRHLERQLQRRQEREAARKRYTLIASIVGTLVIIGLIVGLVVVVGGHNHSSAAASGSNSASATAASPTPSVVTSVSTVSKTTGACGYTQGDASNGAKLTNTGYPPDPKVTPTENRVATFDTNRGTFAITLNGSLAPCNVQSIAYLIGKKYYNNTSCHRLVTSGIYVLQCGDPTGTGAGGPSYETKDENLSKVKYTEGVVAMANAGANTNGSQFFIIYKDSSSGLGPDYTEIGTITSGMNIISAVAAGGSDNSNGTGDGKPKLTLTFKTVTVAPALTGSSTPVPTKTTTVETVTPSATAS